MENIHKLLVSVYGPQDGLRIGIVVLPNLIKDFKGMLEKAMPGLEIREEYCFDDRPGSIVLSGMRLSGGKCRLTKVCTGGRETEVSIAL